MKEEQFFVEKGEVTRARMKLAVDLEELLLKLELKTEDPAEEMNCVALLLQARVTSVPIAVGQTRLSSFSHELKDKAALSRSFEGAIAAAAKVKPHFPDDSNIAQKFIKMCEDLLQQNDAGMDVLQKTRDAMRSHDMDIPVQVAIALRVILERFSGRKLVKTNNINWGPESGKLSIYDTLRSVYDLMGIGTDSRAPANKAMQASEDNEMLAYFQEYFLNPRLTRIDYLDFIEDTLACPANLELEDMPAQPLMIMPFPDEKPEWVPFACV
ncbi:hypothetical protein [Celeribacter naphthalenivorans]|uniref:hypothetical protein n=1 Tax=Celeribacter naphthalenivorans TaxID=1614694 RepID=UPI001CFA48CF|nr:hypothetical protein [Celeribacter naphthalenivorans]